MFSLRPLKAELNCLSVPTVTNEESDGSLVYSLMADLILLSGRLWKILFMLGILKFHSNMFRIMYLKILELGI